MKDEAFNKIVEPMVQMLADNFHSLPTCLIVMDTSGHVRTITNVGDEGVRDLCQTVLDMEIQSATTMRTDQTQ